MLPVGNSGAKMGGRQEKKNKNKSRLEFSQIFEHPVPYWRQKKFGTELDTD